MDCKLVIDNIIFYLDKELQSDEREMFENHLEECITCQEVFNQVKATYITIGMEEIKPDPFFYTRLKARIDRQAENMPVQIFLNVLKPIAVAASIAIGILIGNGELDLLNIPNDEIEIASEEFAPVLPADYSVWITMNEEDGSEN